MKVVVNKIINTNIKSQRSEVERILKTETNSNEYLLKENSGKPILSSGRNISISHKACYVAVALSEPDEIIGIDLEDINQKINKKLFKKYFLNDNENENNIIEIWSVKEAIFKAIGDKFNWSDITITMNNSIIEHKLSHRLSKYLENCKIEIVEITQEMLEGYILSKVIFKRVNNI